MAKRFCGTLPCRVIGRRMMPIRRKATEAGIFDPAEMALLGRVFEQLKLENQSPDERDAIASRIIGNYMAGVVDEDELVSPSRRPLGR
ncbi:msr8070 [Mesorhizobium japonicum MAFF 303099]|uniref:Msr8070 protein n=2 Tax=Mesorhizobium japonicum TaxID=2066070 RepID=Q984B8_RHILO|nr:msr8070 [Mesorhizobium japonicum MAFF 303099]